MTVTADVLKRSAETDRFWCDGTPRCECSGECGFHTHEDEDGRCLEQDGEKALGFAGDVALTVFADCEGGTRVLCERCGERREARRRRETENPGPLMVPLFEGGA